MMVVSEHEIDERQVAAEPITDALSGAFEQDPLETVEVQLEPQESDGTALVQVVCIPIITNISTDAFYCGDTDPIIAVVHAPPIASLSKSLILRSSVESVREASRQETAQMMTLHIMRKQEAQFHHNILALAFFAALILCVVLLAMQYIIVR